MGVNDNGKQNEIYSTQFQVRGEDKIKELLPQSLDGNSRFLLTVHLDTRAVQSWGKEVSVIQTDLIGSHIQSARPQIHNFTTSPLYNT